MALLSFAVAALSLLSFAVWWTTSDVSALLLGVGAPEQSPLGQATHQSEPFCQDTWLLLRLSINASSQRTRAISVLHLRDHTTSA